MPDEKGVLSHEDRVKISEFVNSKAQRDGDPCPHCGSTDTSVANHIFQLQVASPIPTGHIKLIPVSCNNCGNVRLFSAPFTGVVPFPPEPAGDT